MSYERVCTRVLRKKSNFTAATIKKRKGVGKKKLAERKQVDGFFTIKQRLIHLMAAAGFDDHVAVLLEDNIGIVVEIKDGDGRQLDGSTARLGHSIRIHQVDQCLDDGVIGSIHVSV